MKMLKIAITIICFYVTTSQAALVALWSFDSSNTSPATGGSQSGSATFSTTGVSSLTTGTLLNDPRTSPSATQAIAYNTAGGNFTLHISGVGLSGFIVSYAALKNGNSGDQAWFYSTDNSTYTPLATNPKAGPSYTVLTVDFSTITALNGATDVYFRNTFTSDITYDNIQISAVPEPITLSLAVFGLCGIAWRLGRGFFETKLKTDRVKSENSKRKDAETQRRNQKNFANFPEQC